MTDLSLKLARGFSLPLEIVTEASAIVATRGAGKSSTGAVLVEEAVAAGVPTVVIDWTGVFWGLRSNARGDGPGLSVYVLGGPHGDVPLEASAGRFIADLVVDSGHSFVLDLSDFTKGEMRRFCADFLERLYDRKARARTTLLLVIDESHELAPQSPRGGFKGDAARLIAAMEQVAALGRSRGIGVVLITQRTQALNKAVLDLIETLIVMRMLSPRAVAAVRDWVAVKNEDDERGVLASLPELPTGSAWIWSPLRSILERVAVRRIRTFDSYATPKPGEVRVEPSARRELDLDALGERMRETAERVKAEDPAELRKRVSELERALETAAHPGDLVETREELASVQAHCNLTQAELDDIADLLGLPKDGPYAAARDEIRTLIVKADVLRGFENEVRATLSAQLPALRMLTEALGGILERDLMSFASGGNGRVTVSSDKRAVQSAVATSRPSAGGGSRERGTNDGAHTPLPLPAGGRSSRQDPGGAGEQPGSSTATRQKVLDGLAWWEAVGVSTVSRLQLGMIAGYHPRTGTFAQALADLAALGQVQFPQSGHVALLPPGRSLARRPSGPTSEAALHEAIFRQVGERRSLVLRVLLESDPDGISRAEIATQLGYHPRTGTFAQTLADLKALRLVEFPRPGYVSLTPAMFLR